MPVITVLREVISDYPVERRYTLTESDGKMIDGFQIDEEGLLARICRTTKLREPRTEEYFTCTRKLMDGETEEWALDEARRRGEWLGLSHHLVRTMQVKFEDVTPERKSARS